MARASSLAAALAAGPVVLDGGLSTELEARGHDLSSALWSARLLRDDPGAIVAAHAAFAAAGAQVATTASYQASLEGFVAIGVDWRRAQALIERSVLLAREGQGDGWVAGSVGPYGATLADGSEYTGAYVAEMDIRAPARVPPAADGTARAGGRRRAGLRDRARGRRGGGARSPRPRALGVPVWLSLTTVLDDDGVARTRRGERAADVFAHGAGVPAVIAVGVNCTAPAGVGPAVAAAASAGSPSSSTRTAARAGTPSDGGGRAPRASRRTPSPRGWPPARGWWVAAAASAQSTSPRSR